MKPITNSEQLHNIKQHLVQSQKMVAIGTMTAGIAHELNNPIGYIKNNLVVLHDYMQSVLPILKICMDYAQTEQGIELHNQLQSITTSEALGFMIKDINPLLADAIKGSEKLENIAGILKRFVQTDDADGQLFDLNQCVRDSLLLAKNELKYKATVHQQLGTLPSVHGHPREINQVIMNILLNAAQAITEYGDISIRTHASPTEVILSLSDTGEGIAEKNQPQLFNPFFTTREKCAGLGLYISKEIIQAHGGSIEVASQTDLGTTITISLPIAESE